MEIKLFLSSKSLQSIKINAIMQKKYEKIQNYHVQVKHIIIEALQTKDYLKLEYKITLLVCKKISEWKYFLIFIYIQFHTC